MKNKGIAKYSQVAVESGLGSASPYRMVQMLFQGALDKLSAAKGFMERKEFGKKSENISWASSIINGLRNSLDLETGGEIAANLDALYEYMVFRLIEANMRNDPDIIKEVVALLTEIKEAWDAMPEGIRGGERQTFASARAAAY
jgi:flagellar protein FliS